MPMRWPRQQVRKLLIARTPRSSLPPTRRRAWAGGGVARRRQASASLGNGPLPSIGSPKAFTTRPSQARLGRITGSLSTSSARQPRPTPSSEPKAMASARPVRNPTTSQGMHWPARLMTSQREPTDRWRSRPATSTNMPRTVATRP